VKNFSKVFQLLAISSVLFIWSCSEDEPDPEPEFNCSESTLALTAESPDIAGCLTTEGSIVATGSGGVGTLMYSLDDGPFQMSPEFTNLSPGIYTVKVTDDTECTESFTTKVSSGISFEAEIKSIIENSCAVAGCHDGSSNQPNFLEFSNLQSRAAGVKSRTQSGDMPRNGTLTAEEIAKIACWVDDGALDN